MRFQPHQVIGAEHNPYLLRWYILPRNRFLNVYLHKFLRSDDDRAMHDHPWWFMSYIVKGSYWEHRKDRPLTARSYRSAGTFAFRKAEDAHRVELESETLTLGPPTRDGIVTHYHTQEVERPVWTVIVTGPRIRRWGFHCPEGWKFWEDFVHDNGCGEQ